MMQRAQRTVKMEILHNNIDQVLVHRLCIVRTHGAHAHVVDAKWTGEPGKAASRKKKEKRKKVKNSRIHLCTFIVLSEMQRRDKKTKFL